MLRLGRNLRRIATKAGEDAFCRVLRSRKLRRSDLGGLPLRPGLSGIRRAHAPDRRVAAVEGGGRACRRTRSRLARRLSQARRSRRGGLRCAARESADFRDDHAARCPRHLRPNCRDPHCCGEGCDPEVAAGARHRARSQVHPEDHHRRAAHRAEREPGRRGDCQGLRRAAGARAARQHAAGRYRWHAATRGGASSRPGADAAVSSHRLHAGQPGEPMPKKPSSISSTRRSKTSTTASAPRRIAEEGRCASSRARSTK